MPNVDLTLDTVEVDQLLPSLGWMDNIQAGVIPYGFGIYAEFPIQAGVQPSFFVPIQVEIGAPFIEPPTEPLCVHLGQGVVLFSFNHSNPSLVQYYELLAANALAGPYASYQAGRFFQRRGLVRNVTMGATAYFRIRAVGRNGAISTATQVKQGKIITPTLVNLKVRGIQGSILPANAIFSGPDRETGQLVMMRVQNTTTLT